MPSTSWPNRTKPVAAQIAILEFRRTVGIKRPLLQLAQHQQLGVQKRVGHLRLLRPAINTHRPKLIGVLVFQTGFNIVVFVRVDFRADIALYAARCWAYPAAIR